MKGFHCQLRTISWNTDKDYRLIVSHKPPMLRDGSVRHWLENSTKMAEIRHKLCSRSEVNIATFTFECPKASIFDCFREALAGRECDPKRLAKSFASCAEFMITSDFSRGCMFLGRRGCGHFPLWICAVSYGVRCKRHRGRRGRLQPGFRTPPSTAGRRRGGAALAQPLL